MPGPQVETDEQFIEEIRVRGVSNLHPVGTCRMGREVDAVVDPRLRVHGITGLRVADASIMPQVPGGNTNAPSIMIGEKCAAMILEDARAAIDSELAGAAAIPIAAPWCASRVGTAGRERGPSWCTFALHCGAIA